MTTPVNVIDDSIPIIAEAVQEWMKKNSKAVLTKKVQDMLDKSSTEVVMKLLGFDTSYSKTWELDHCNGRSGNSAAGDYLRKTQEDAIKEWLGTVPLPALSEATQKSLLRSIQSDYKYAVEKALGKLVLAKAEADAHQLMNQLTASKQIDNYMAAMKLVLGEPNAS